MLAFVDDNGGGGNIKTGHGSGVFVDGEADRDETTTAARLTATV